MPKRTYTTHKLSDRQLVILSQLSGGRRHYCGNALIALERKGLARETIPGGRYGWTHCATLEGKQALAHARMEGW